MYLLQIVESKTTLLFVCVKLKDVLKVLQHPWWQEIALLLPLPVPNFSHVVAFQCSALANEQHSTPPPPPPQPSDGSLVVCGGSGWGREGQVNSGSKLPGAQVGNRTTTSNKHN